MSKPPRRKRLQMHLSTAVLMMVAAVGFIWANTKARIDYPNQWAPPPILPDILYSKTYGWPSDAAWLP